MLLYIMLYIMLAYLMLFAALSNAVCLYNAFLQLLIFANAFCFMLCLGLLAQFVYFKYDFPIMHSAFDLLVFPNSMFTPFLK